MFEYVPDFKIDDICQDFVKQGDYATISNFARVDKRIHSLCQKYLDAEQNRRELGKIVTSIMQSLSLSFLCPEQLSEVFLSALLESNFSIKHGQGDFNHFIEILKQSMHISPRFQRISEMILVDHCLLSSNIKVEFELKFQQLAEEVKKTPHPDIIPLLHRCLINCGFMRANPKVRPVLNELYSCLHMGMGEVSLSYDFLNTLRSLLIKTDFIILDEK
jgi:hypothetical protein